MRRKLVTAFRRHEIYLVALVIGLVFVSAMAIVAWVLRGSLVAPPYDALTDRDLKRVFATGYLRYREGDGSAYLKVELHNGTMWWIKKVEFDFDGLRYSLKEDDAFRPLHSGAVRCPLRKDPPISAPREQTLQIEKAFGYPPAGIEWGGKGDAVARDPSSLTGSVLP